jgi:hypothetical protein
LAAFSKNLSARVSPADFGHPEVIARRTCATGAQAARRNPGEVAARRRPWRPLPPPAPHPRPPAAVAATDHGRRALWRAVQERRELLNASGVHRLGGMQRTERSRKYLFSGILACGPCGGSIVICAGGGKRGYVKYGCHTHKRSGMCDNKLMIRFGARQK